MCTGVAHMRGGLGLVLSKYVGNQAGIIAFRHVGCANHTADDVNELWVNFGEFSCLLLCNGRGT